MNRDPDYPFWLALHRALIALASVIETYKLKAKPPAKPRLFRSRRGRPFQRVSARELLDRIGQH
jgi:hypothetical protein